MIVTRSPPIFSISLTLSLLCLSFVCFLSCFPLHTRRSMWHVSDRSQPSSTSDERNHVKPHPTILLQQKAPKLRFVSSVEFRHSSGKFPKPKKKKKKKKKHNSYFRMVAAHALGISIDRLSTRI